MQHTSWQVKLLSQSQRSQCGNVRRLNFVNTMSTDTHGHTSNLAEGSPPLNSFEKTSAPTRRSPYSTLKTLALLLPVLDSYKPSAPTPLPVLFIKT